MYFCQPAAIKQSGRKLIDACAFEAWKLGSLSPSVYMNLRVFIGVPIRCSKYPEQDTLPESAAKTVFYRLNKWPWEIFDYALRDCGGWKKTYVPDTKTVIPGELNMQDAALYSED